MKRETYILWSVIGCLTLIGGVGLKIQGISINKHLLFFSFAPVSCLLIVSFFYRKIRQNETIALLTEMAAATLAFMAALSFLSYLVISFKAPLIDAYLLAVDRHLGFNWIELYKWVTQRPVLWIAMKLVYLMLIPEIFILEIVFIMRKEAARAKETLWLFILVCLASVVCSGFLPAEGAFAVFHVSLGEPYVREFAALRDGSLKIISTTGGLKSLVEFPSLHMALALSFLYALRAIRIVFPVFLTLNILIMVTLPIIGGHYLSDLLAGALLAAGVIVMSRWWKRQSKCRPAVT